MNKGEKVNFVKAIKDGNKDISIDKYFTLDRMFKFCKYLRKKELVSKRLQALIHNLETFRDKGWKSILPEYKPGKLKAINKAFRD